MDSKDSSFQTCLNLLSSKVDEEKFVGIILVKNLIKADDYKSLNQVYSALGLDFLYRLLQTPKTPGVESISYVNLSVAILSTFCTAEQPLDDNTTIEDTSIPINNNNNDDDDGVTASENKSADSKNENNYTIPSTTTINESILYNILYHPLTVQIVPMILTRSIESESSNVDLLYESIQTLYSLCSFENTAKDELNKLKKSSPTATTTHQNTTTESASATTTNTTNIKDKSNKSDNSGKSEPSVFIKSNNFNSILDALSSADNLRLLGEFLLHVHNISKKFTNITATTIKGEEDDDIVEEVEAKLFVDEKQKQKIESESESDCESSYSNSSDYETDSDEESPEDEEETEEKIKQKKEYSISVLSNTIQLTINLMLLLVYNIQKKSINNNNNIKNSFASSTITTIMVNNNSNTDSESVSLNNIIDKKKKNNPNSSGNGLNNNINNEIYQQNKNNDLILIEPLSIFFKERFDEFKFSILSILIPIFSYHQDITTQSFISLFSTVNNLIPPSSSNNENNNENSSTTSTPPQNNEENNEHNKKIINDKIMIWRDNFIIGLYSIFSSRKLKQEWRNNSIVFYSILLDVMGGKWIFMKQLQQHQQNISSEKFLLLSLQMVRTEIHMILLLQEIISEEHEALLSSCYLAIENTVLFLTTYFDDSNEFNLPVTNELSKNNSSSSGSGSNNKEEAVIFSIDTFGKINDILVESITIILNYLKQVAEETPDIKPTQLVIGSIKLLGLWIAEETKSMSSNLKLSLHFILQYLLKYRDEFGYYLCFLFPGISFYIENSSDDIGGQSENGQGCREAFFSNHCHLRIANYLTYYLPSLIEFIKDPSIKSNQIINNLRDYGVSADITVNIIIPRACEIIFSYLNNELSLNNSFPGTTTRTAFVQLLFTCVECMDSLSNDIISRVTVDANNNNAVDENVIANNLNNNNLNNGINNGSIVTYQFLIGTLVSLSLGILKNLEEKDLQSSPQGEEILNKLFNSTIKFYIDIQLPGVVSTTTTNNNENNNELGGRGINDENDIETIQIIWDTIKEEWVNGLDLMVQIIDRFKQLSNCLQLKRWPATDLRVVSSSLLGLEQHTIVQVNRNIGTLIRSLLRKMLESNSFSSSLS